MGSEARAANPLLDNVDIADEYVEQQDFNDAATLYEIIIRGILDNYDTFRWHADEGQLDDVVEGCVEGLSDCLRGMQRDIAARRHILQALFDVYDFDMSLENDMPVMSSEVPAILVRYTTPEERLMVAKWVRKAFDLDIDWHTYEAEEFAESFEVLLLGLEADGIDDETFLRLSHEMESYNYIVDRLLKRGRLEEALAEAKQVDDFDILEIADILSEHGYEDQAMQLIEERVEQHSSTDLLHWLQERYQSRGNPEGALEIAKRTFTAHFFEATIERYREIRELAQQLARWDEVRAELLAHVKQSHLTFTRSPQKVIGYHGLWPDLLAVCRYFLDHPMSNLYIRELPISMHTKFIEQHRGIVRELLEQLLPQEAMPLAATTFEQRFGLREKEALVRVRLLDEQLYNRYRLPLTELSVPVSQLEALDLLRGQRCIVTENEMTFLTLPPYKDTFALFGGGFIVHNLEGISWLAQCPIIYWGDLDAQGFQILSRLRAFFPHVVSVMMDWETLSAFSEFCVASTPCLIRQLPHLTHEEHALFLHLAENNLRLEQEHISHAYAVRQLCSIITNVRSQV